MAANGMIPLARAAIPLQQNGIRKPLRTSQNRSQNGTMQPGASNVGGEMEEGKVVRRLHVRVRYLLVRMP